MLHILDSNQYQFCLPPCWGYSGIRRVACVMSLVADRLASVWVLVRNMYIWFWHELLSCFHKLAWLVSMWTGCCVVFHFTVRNTISNNWYIAHNFKPTFCNIFNLTDSMVYVRKHTVIIINYTNSASLGLAALTSGVNSPAGRLAKSRRFSCCLVSVVSLLI